MYVIRPYEEGDIGHTQKTSLLLVDDKLRKEYGELYVEIEKSQDVFVHAMKTQSGSKKELIKEISSTFTKSDDEFYRALIRVKDEVSVPRPTLHLLMLHMTRYLTIRFLLFFPPRM